MQRTFLLICLALLTRDIVAAATLHAEPKEPATELEKVEPPLIVSPVVLAEAVHDDVDVAAKKYHLTELQIEGVVSNQSMRGGVLGRIDFYVTFKDRKTGKDVEFVIFCGLKEGIAQGNKQLEELAVGKKVTIRGKSTSTGNGQVTLIRCVIVLKDGHELGKQP